ncbi:MAG: UDP-N-acetylmuramoyl-L-alanyl-D-glutamate--2,6-diaminopimelate ligase [Chthoniobacterales bacterium]
MKLHHLLEQTKIEGSSEQDDREITALCLDSRKAIPGCLFFAIHGLKADGAHYAKDAAHQGAVAVITDTDIDLDIPVIRVADVRVAMAQIASVFYGDPSQALRVFGITGTNGKTTSAFILKHICESSNMPCGLIGTVQYVIGNSILAAPRTTPESIELQELIASMRDYGCRAVSMEVSSHALVQHRVDGIEFDSAIFTNLTQDHLDYHQTMERYFEAKVQLFEQLCLQKNKPAKAIINADDRYGQLLINRYGGRLPIITFGQGVLADFRAGNIRATPTGTTFQLEAKQKIFLVKLPLIGSFNVYNALGALAAATASGIDIHGAVHAMEKIPQVPGRLERVATSRAFQVYVDYAHTPDALESALKTLRLMSPRKIITVFGCGGDRDRGKRPLMGQAAEKNSDWCVVTSDNPRTEDPEQILKEILTGMPGKNHETVIDRKEAIRRAVDLAARGDIVLIAGKGHETYQEINGRTIPFNDVAIARSAIEDKPMEVMQ